MKEFLKKYMSEEELKKLEESYIAANPEAKSLPVYISKKRLDDEIAKKKGVEDELANMKAQLEESQKGSKEAIDAALKAAENAHKAALDEALKNQKLDFDITEAIYKSKGKDAVSIRAHFDKSKPIDEEIKRIQKECPYLFEGSIPQGTGKDGSKDGPDLETERMKKAVGVL